MKGLFIYDGPISKDNGKYYGVALNGNMFAKYKDIVDELNIAIKVKDVTDAKNRLLPIEFGFVKDIIKLPNLKFINKNEIKKILIKEIEKVDVVIVRMPSNNGRIACDILRKMKKKYIVEMVGCTWDAAWNHSLKGKIIAPYWYLKTKYCIKHADNIMYVTNEFLQRRYPNNKNNIGVSDVEIPENIERVQRKTIENKKQKIIFGTVGSVKIKQKGQEYVIKALRKLLDEGYNVEYQLVGNGEPTRLKAIAEKYNVTENVKFMGGMPHDKVFEWLKTIDIYTQPSKAEGLSRSVVEAMSIGCPCIVSNAGGNAELINKKYVFKKKNINQFIEEFKQILDEIEEQSIENYERSKLYNGEALRKRKVEFYNVVMSE